MCANKLDSCTTDRNARLGQSLLRTGFTALAVLILGAASGCDKHNGEAEKTTPDAVKVTPPNKCERTIKADVVALEQVYYYNRFGSFNPAGMMYALRRDVVVADDEYPELDGKPIANGGEPGKVRLRADKRPRPLVLRVNEGDCLKVTFTNLLSPTVDGAEVFPDPANGRPVPLDSEDPTTRHASMHVNGLDYVDSIESDGANVGRNPSSLAAPGETKTYTWYAKKEGAYLFYSMAAPAGGEGDGGQVGLGLFGSVNVQPRGAKWYRSQVTAEELKAATTGATRYGQPIINYEATFPAGSEYPDSHLSRGKDPVLNLLKDDEIIYSDLNAVIEISSKHDRKTDSEGEDCGQITGPGSACGQSYREFTSLFHDEITAEQAYPELQDEDNPISSLRDGTGINYGSAGMGAMVLANSKYHEGPAKDCQECKLEEFFLTSWVNGDPAMVVEKNANRRAVKGLYPDDPSNVHHSYIGDPVRFRNLHAGPKETHVFHLHAHQWVQDKHDPDSVYLDSQTISPGSVFSYEIHYGGGGNRNFTVGDAIFHCHLYPHFAQGMWELWRNHDVFEAGTYDRWLPDAEIGTTPNPAVVPLPAVAMAPMPTADFKGYPFYIAAREGHRPPQAPLDIEADREDPKTLQRHRIESATLKSPPEGPDKYLKSPNHPSCKQPQNDLYDKGRRDSSCIAGRVHGENSDPELLGLALELKTAQIRQLPLDGTPEEKTAMDFHEGKTGARLETSAYGWLAKGYPSCDSSGRCDGDKQQSVLFHVNGRPPKPGAPFADPCPDTYKDATGVDQPVGPDREYRAAYLQLDLTVNKDGWHDPQGRIAVLEEDVKNTLSRKRPTEPLFFRANSGECIQFKATNLIPSVLNLDDFQVYSPTDTMGQHIHLVKFDVTASDGSGNGWNYEDGTFSPDELRERMAAHNRQLGEGQKTQWLKPVTHPMFKTGPMAKDNRGVCPDSYDPEEWDKHPWCGAQTTIQRWWADPLLNKPSGAEGARDRTIRTVFTHDHFGPSSHQQHGFYAALVVEPSTAEWQRPDGCRISGKEVTGAAMCESGRKDGGPTSYAANIIVPREGQSKCQNQSECDNEHTAREFNMAFADFALLYTSANESDERWRNRPVNPTNRIDEAELPEAIEHPRITSPQGISTADPGSQLINYRNEPIPLRIAEKSGVEYSQRKDDRGDVANVFSSTIHQGQSSKDASIFTEPLKSPPTARHSGDPATPLLRAYEGDRVQIRLIQGAQEENHTFTMHGVKWLSQPESKNSGWMNAQPIGISEHFEFDVNIITPSDKVATDFLYMSSASDNLWDGQWGLLRAYPATWEKSAETEVKTAGLARLPSNPAGARKRPTTKQRACPGGAPEVGFDVTAMSAKQLLPGKGLSYNEHFNITDPNAIIFFETEDKDALMNGQKQIEPLILRARAGDCIKLTLHNQLPADMADGLSAPDTWSFNSMPPITEGFNFNQMETSRHVSLHPQLLAFNVQREDGANVGFNLDSTVPPCRGTGPNCREVKPVTYEWYAGDTVFDGEGVLHPAPIEFGVVSLQDRGDVIKHSSHGAVGALVIEPEHAVVDDKKYPGCGPDRQTWIKGKKEAVRTNASATICDAKGKPLFREFVAVYQDDLTVQWRGQPMANLRNGDDAEDTGQKAFNYRMEPLWARLGATPSADPEVMSEIDWHDAFSSLVSHAECTADPEHGKYCDPETPIFEASAGMPVRFRVVHPGGKPRNHAFTVFGHDWIMNPWVCDSSVMGWNRFSPTRFGSIGGIGPGRHVNIMTTAGGDFHVPGDYLYRTQEGFMFGGGEWGIFRVTEEENSPLTPVPKCPPPPLMSAVSERNAGSAN